MKNYLWMMRGVIPTEHKDITVSTAKAPTPEEVDRKLAILAQAAHSQDVVVCAALREVIPTYMPEDI